MRALLLASESDKTFARFLLELAWLSNFVWLLSYEL